MLGEITYDMISWMNNIAHDMTFHVIRPIDYSVVFLSADMFNITEDRCPISSLKGFINSFVIDKRIFGQEFKSIMKHSFYESNITGKSSWAA